MGVFKRSPGCTCCGGSGCCEVADAFSTIDDWTQTSGTWSISSGKVTTTSTDAILTHDTADFGDCTAPANDMWYKISFNSSANNVIRFFLFYDTATGNYAAIEIDMANDTWKAVDHAGTVYRNCDYTFNTSTDYNIDRDWETT